MRRRRLLISVGLVVGFVALVLVGLAVMVEARAELLPAGRDAGRTRPGRLSQEADGQLLRIINALDDPSWEVTFSAEQSTHTSSEDYYYAGGDNNLPDGFHAPRVKIEDGKMRIGVRYGPGWRARSCPWKSGSGRWPTK